MAHTRQEIHAELATIIQDVTGISAAEVTPDKTFIDDLDIDSLSMVEIGVALQDTLGVEIPDDDLIKIKTVGDFLDHVERLQTAS
ncbi:meromycolate extension acyl carrier protein AcpM [Streptosporangium fragile]|uniref:Acyl carrier protein n=1 Tax=Streptosporangium fragile TaxID=46186 RepID=A0ABN3VR52_9ACTN